MTAYTIGAEKKEAPALLQQGFRPFFLFAAVWAIASVGLWIGMLTGWIVVPSRFDSVTWHAHEAIYGFAAAAVAGFLLTAIPNWTGRLPVSGIPLGVLVGLWTAGRIATATSALWPAGLAAAVDLSFLAALAVVAAREIVAGRNWRNLVVLAALLVLSVGNALMHAEAVLEWPIEGLGWRIGLGMLLVMISLIGGRIVPSFTRNWLMHAGDQRLPAAFGPFDRAALISGLVALAVWAIAPDWSGAGWLLAFAGVVHGIRLARWRGTAIGTEPLLWVLHLGYGWLAFGLVLYGLAQITGLPALAGAMHALTAGAVGTMVLGVMTRATLGHTGRSLTAGPGTVAVYVMVTLGALLRVGAPLAGAGEIGMLALGGVLWVSAFAMFVGLYGPMLCRARADR